MHTDVPQGVESILARERTQPCSGKNLPQNLDVQLVIDGILERAGWSMQPGDYAEISALSAPDSVRKKAAFLSERQLHLALVINACIRAVANRFRDIVIRQFPGRASEQRGRTHLSAAITNHVRRFCANLKVQTDAYWAQCPLSPPWDFEKVCKGDRDEHDPMTHLLPQCPAKVNTRWIRCAQTILSGRGTECTRVIYSLPYRIDPLQQLRIQGLLDHLAQWRIKHGNPDHIRVFAWLLSEVLATDKIN